MSVVIHGDETGAFALVEDRKYTDLGEAVDAVRRMGRRVGNDPPAVIELLKAEWRQAEKAVAMHFGSNSPNMGRQSSRQRNRASGDDRGSERSEYGARNDRDRDNDFREERGNARMDNGRQVERGNARRDNGRQVERGHSDSRSANDERRNGRREGERYGCSDGDEGCGRYNGNLGFR